MMGYFSPNPHPLLTHLFQHTGAICRLIDKGIRARIQCTVA